MGGYDVTRLVAFLPFGLVLRVTTALPFAQYWAVFRALLFRPFLLLLLTPSVANAMKLRFPVITGRFHKFRKIVVTRML